MSREITLPPRQATLPDGSHAAGWWRDDEEGGTLQCCLCARGCRLAPGQRGFCFVRENRDGQLVCTTYGRSTGFCVDPIEKKPLNHFYPGTSVLSFGTAGCNLGCKFCQNWTTTKSRDVEAMCEAAAPEVIAEAARRLRCRSVAFTYNDPIVWVEYAIDTARACRQAGVKTVAVTSGYMEPAAREAFYEHIDAANVDLKGFSEDFYRRLCGGSLQPVLDTLRWLARHTQVWLEITNLVIPGENDSPQEIERMCRWIVDELGPDVPLHFSAFHPDFHLTDHGSTPPETLIAAHDIARRARVRYVYTGNVVDRRRQATYCPECAQTVIERDGYVLGEYHICGGRCAKCRAVIAGRFDDVAGDWGGKRLPVRIGSVVPSRDSSARLPTSPPPQALTPLAKQAGDVDRPILSAEQERRVFQAAGKRVAATVRRGLLAQTVQGMLAEAAATPVYGAFVSLKRAGRLRSCCGFLGQSVPLHEALDRAAVRAAKDDPRFPPISPTEIDHLDMEVWLLWGLQPVNALGPERMQAVTIGKHGLQISRGQARGLLLPGVATEHHLDAGKFLQQVCLKAGLPPDAWLQDDTTLMTFEGYSIHGKLATAGLEPAEETGSERGSGHDAKHGPAERAGNLPCRSDVLALAQFCRNNLEALLRGSTPSYYLADVFDGGIHGLSLRLGAPGMDDTLELTTVSLRADMPLQSTLFQLTQTAAGILQTRRLPLETVRAVPLVLSVLADPVPHGMANGPDLQGIAAGQRALLVQSSTVTAWGFDPARTPEELLQDVLKAACVEQLGRAHVFSLAVVSSEPRSMVVQASRLRTGPEVRPAAVAGAFYPGTVRDIHRALDDLFSNPLEKPVGPWAAALVPHAGWTYSGRLTAAVFRRVQIPEQVIVLCPKHRPGGAAWAVAPHGRWAFPGGELAGDLDLGQLLAEGIEGLELDSIAHRQEHAIEVQLPILARLAADTRVVGITIGEGNLERLQRFARQMADVLRSLPSRPLLVISSDMNHFADDARTRRLDRMVLDAIEALDPPRLFETVERNRISMCGMRPTVIVMETLRQLDALRRCEFVGYTTSAEASGDTTRVVGYAGVLMG